MILSKEGCKGAPSIASAYTEFKPALGCKCVKWD